MDHLPRPTRARTARDLDSEHHQPRRHAGKGAAYGYALRQVARQAAPAQPAVQSAYVQQRAVALMASVLQPQYVRLQRDAYEVPVRTADRFQPFLRRCTLRRSGRSLHSLTLRQREDVCKGCRLWREGREADG